MDLSKLNNNQVEAITSIDGPVMAIAGAGSGKTSVLTYRLAYMIEQGIDAYNILAVTFTNKAAQEMRERAYKLAGDDALMATICTFHSFCAKILRIEVTHTKYQRNFEIVDEEDSLTYVKTAIKDLNLDPNEYKPKIIKSLISREKNGNFFHSKDKSYQSDFRRLYDRYNLLLLEDNCMDFDDMLINTYNLFFENKDILFKYQNRYRYIMIDEFQDTNTIQYKLITMLAISSRNLFIVGDEDQSIYSFRGARIENIKSFQNDFKEHKKIILNQNYRSNQNILDAANSVIKNNQSRIKKDLFSNKKSNNLIIYKRLDSQFEEESFVVNEITRLHETIPYSQIAILYRNNALSRGIEESLLRKNIPYKIFGGFSYFQRKEVKDIISYLRLIIDDISNISVKRLANIPKRHIGKGTLDKLEQFSKMNKMSMFQAIDYFDNKYLVEFKASILNIRNKVSKEPLNKYIDIILVYSGYLDYLKEESDEERENRLDNIYEFNSLIEEVLETNPNVEKNELLELLLEDITLRTDKNDVSNTDKNDFVSVMTYHQSKGLEFEVVFMIATEEGIFPSFRSVDENNIEEERRLCYVGITRAKDQLYITNAKIRRLYGMINQSDPSRFIKEIDQNCIMKPKIEIRKERVIEKPNESNINKGDKVSHKFFGEGVVISIEGDLAKIAFKAPNGIKTILINHPALSKL